MALPDDFQWRPWVEDDRALVFGGRNIALVCPLANGRCRVALNVGSDQLRFQFFNTTEAGRRYVEAWATKWADRLRELYGAGRGLMFRP
ncbi:hypothetical protein NB717_000022 [Xanthomonas sacchari]|uniref:hypothetical protein n=1 Tax=Xanthomonas sacchari TaxID=56458 RepID=UPI00225DDA7D|nr:hypothetical protein [Xanthomonas sacchari]MCW0458954.1 hypothetical protein [Xanthomonas sacchari]